MHLKTCMPFVTGTDTFAKTTNFHVGEWWTIYVIVRYAQHHRGWRS